MAALVTVVLLLVVLGLAGLRWGADTRDGRDWQPVPDSSGRPARGVRIGFAPVRRRGWGGVAWRSLRNVWATQVELQQRLDLLNRPWEEEFLHWAGQGPDQRLHGRLTPPGSRRRASVTSSGWCPGHGRDAQEPATPDTTEPPRPLHGPCRRPGSAP